MQSRWLGLLFEASRWKLELDSSSSFKQKFCCDFLVNLLQNFRQNFREVDVLEFGAGAPFADFWAEFEVEGPHSIGLRPKNRLSLLYRPSA